MMVTVFWNSAASTKTRWCLDVMDDQEPVRDIGDDLVLDVVGIAEFGIGIIARFDNAADTQIDFCDGHGPARKSCARREGVEDGLRRRRYVDRQLQRAVTVRFDKGCVRHILEIAPALLGKSDIRRRESRRYCDENGQIFLVHRHLLQKLRRYAGNIAF
jgi:hypothetical protein